MEFVFDLWLPILVGTFVLWVLSCIAWAVLPHHFGDHGKVPDENSLMELVQQADIPAGNYISPYAASGKEQSSKEFSERYAEGPRGTLNIYEMPNMLSNMLQTILYFFVTVFTIA